MTPLSPDHPLAESQLKWNLLLCHRSHQTSLCPSHSSNGPFCCDTPLTRPAVGRVTAAMGLPKVTPLSPHPLLAESQPLLLRHRSHQIRLRPIHSCNGPSCCVSALTTHAVGRVTAATGLTAVAPLLPHRFRRWVSKSRNGPYCCETGLTTPAVRRVTATTGLTALIPLLLEQPLAESQLQRALML